LRPDGEGQARRRLAHRVEIIAVRVGVGHAGQEHVRSGPREFLGQHGGVVGDRVAVGELPLDLREADLPVGIRQQVDAMPRAQEQAAVMGFRGRSQVDRARRAEPRQVLAPGPGPGEDISRRRHPVARAAAAVALVAEGVGGQHPVRMPLRRKRKRAVVGQRLLGRTVERSGRKAFVQVDPERGGLRQRVEAGLVDELEQVLLDRGEGHGGTGGKGTACPASESGRCSVSGNRG
jgi:hypothetical protein